MGGRRVLGVAALGVVGALLAGCSVVTSLTGGAARPPDAGVVPPDQMTVNISNGSTLDVALFVNGIQIGAPVPASQGAGFRAGDLPPLPWTVEVRSPSGRVLVATAVHAGDVWTRPVGDGGTESKGVGARVDLSCGRIDVWSGFPMSGSAPGPGTPGDCAP